MLCAIQSALHSEILEVVDHVGLHGLRRCQIGIATCHIAEFALCHAAKIKRTRAIRIQFEGRIRVRGCVGKMARTILDQRARPVEMALRRLQLDRLIAIRDGDVELLSPQRPDLTRHIERSEICGVQFHHVVVILCGVRVVLRTEISIGAFAEYRRGIVGSFQRLRIVIDSIQILIQSETRVTTLPVDKDFLGIELECLGVIFYRLCRLSQPVKDLCPRRIRGGMGRIDLERLIGVGERFLR